MLVDKPKSSFFGSINEEDPWWEREVLFLISITSDRLSSSEYLIRIHTEAQFAFPLVRIKLIQDSALNVGSSIQGWAFSSFHERWFRERVISLVRLTNLGPDLLVSTDIGLLYRISWDGSIHHNLTLALKTMSYTSSLNSDRGNIVRLIGDLQFASVCLVFKIPNNDRFAKCIEFSPLLNGIGVVFSDGTSGLIICETSKFEPQVDFDVFADRLF